MRWLKLKYFWTQPCSNCTAVCRFNALQYTIKLHTGAIYGVSSTRILQKIDRAITVPQYVLLAVNANNTGLAFRCAQSSIYLIHIIYMIWYMIWCDVKWSDVMWCDVWCDMIWYMIYAMLCYAMLCYAMICYAMQCSAMIWYDMIWYDMIWYDMIWQDMIYERWDEMRWRGVTWHKVRWDEIR